MTPEAGFASPEEAALDDFPPQYARVVAVRYSRRGRKATVELATNEEPTLYPYFVNCEMDAEGKWHEKDSHN